jgi:hypothetical protein
MMMTLSTKANPGVSFGRYCWAFVAAIIGGIIFLLGLL